MIKILSMAVSIFCVATVGTLICGAAFLWYQGDLTDETVTDVKSILRGEDPAMNSVVRKENDPQPSFQDIANLRAKSILSLTEREAELQLVKQTIDTQIEDLVKRRELLDKKQAEFEKSLDEITKTIASEAREQARGILLKMKPELAAQNLLALTPEEAIELVKGMGEKDVARILERFPKGTEAAAEEIFMAIARGKPKLDAIENAKEGLNKKESPNDSTNSPKLPPKTANAPLPTRKS